MEPFPGDTGFGWRDCTSDFAEPTGMSCNNALMNFSRYLYLGFLLSSLLPIGCAKPPSAPPPKSTTSPFVDLLVTAEKAHLVHQFDQTFVGLELNSRHWEHSFHAELQAPIEMVLSGTYGRGQDGLSQTPIELHWEIKGAEGFSRQASIELEAGTTGFRKRADLSGCPSGPLTLSIHGEIPPGHRIFLRDILIRQQMMSADSGMISGDSGKRPPQLLLISVDTLREDALGSFGSPWETPNLDALAAEGQVWSPNYPGGAWTKPSHATMLTGYRGDTHGILSPEDVLSPRLPTIASRFQQAKIPTAGFVYDCKWLDAKWGFSKGFEEYHVDPYSVSRSWRPVANWASTHRNLPFFLFFHTFEPHSDFFHLPYESPGTDRRSIEAEFGLKNYGCEEDACSSRRMELINDGKLKLSPGEIDVMKELYGRGVEETDRALGEFFAALKAMGIWDNMLLVLTSDHGESFMEHGKLLHGYMWNEVIRVPLIVKWPQGLKAGSRGPVPSASIDIAPTLLEAAGLDLGDLPGTPLQRLSVERPQYVFGGSRAVIDGRWKVIFSGDLSRALRTYDLAIDPKEGRDLSGTRPEVFDRLRKIARELTQKDWELRDRYQAEDTSTAKLTEEEKEKLRALGYLD